MVYLSLASKWPHKWLLDYLSNRVQSVRYLGCNSAEKTINIGVPQGSILGPILFLIYINDIFRAGHSGELILFADDANYFESSEDYLHLINSVNNNLKYISQWFLANRLAINIIKSEAMLFSRKTIYFPLPLLILNASPISYNYVFKFLGVLFDFKLNWKQHIRMIGSKLSSACGILFRLRNKVTSQVAKTIYYNIAHPHLIYCNIVWTSCYPSNIHPLVIIQKRLIRVIMKCNRRTPSSPLFSQLKILKLTDVNKLNTAIFVYKSINNLIHSPITFQNRNIAQYNLRNQHNLDIPIHVSRQTELFVHVRGARLCNTIPDDIKRKNTTFSFKRSLKHYLMNTYV